MNNLYCKKETTLSLPEKKQFQKHLKRYGLSDNVWDLFDEFIAIASSGSEFFYIKAYTENKEPAGMGLFFKVKPYDLSSTNRHFRTNAAVKKIISGISSILNNCVYFSFGFLTANLTRPFFFNDPDHESLTLKAILSFIKQEKEADMVIIMDGARHGDIYRHEGFKTYPSPSEAWIDPTAYSDISAYLKTHRSAKKHISQKKKTILAEIKPGPVLESDAADMMECLKHSIDHSRMNTPFQNMFEKNISNSELFTSSKYLYINIRINQKIVGFTNYILSGSTMAAVIGGYNRNFTRNNYIYERLFVKSLEYAIKNGITRLNYGIVDNFTKLRLTGSFDPVSMYFYSPNFFIRKTIDFSKKSNDMYELCLLEKQGMKKYYKKMVKP